VNDKLYSNVVAFPDLGRRPPSSDRNWFYEPVLDADIAVLWQLGFDTWEIAQELFVHESVISAQLTEARNLIRLVAVQRARKFGKELDQVYRECHAELNAERERYLQMLRSRRQHAKSPGGD